MTIKIKNITTYLELFPLIKGARGILLFSILLFSISFANAELNAKWYTKSLNVQVGDSVKIDLFIYPREDHPVVTVSNTLKYDTEKLEFVNAIFPDNWFVLSEKPNYLTDTKNGIIRRTGGKALGVFENSKYLTYEFKAIKEGQAQLNIDDGFVLDYENTDLGLGKKQMTINISAAATSTNANPPSAKTFSLGIDVFGKNAIRLGQDYSLDIYPEQNFSQNISTDKSGNSGAVSIQVLDDLRREIFTDSKSFPSISLASPKPITFSVPNSALKVGDYSVQLKTIYRNNKNEIVSESTDEKELGVLDTDRTWLDIHQLELFIFFIFIIILAALYHIHYDHIYFRELRHKANLAHHKHFPKE